MNWQQVTVGQYQQIIPILEEDNTDLDKLVRMIAIVEGKPESEIDGWPLNKLHEYRFLFDLDFPKVTPKKIKAGKKYYRFVYEIQKMPAARYIEAKTFLQDGLINNLHKIMASCVVPMDWLGWFDRPYKATEHENYAKDLLDAPFPVVYNACLFFCLVFAHSMKNSKTFLEAELSKNLTPQQMTELSEHLTSISDGIITQALSLNMNE